MIYAEVPNVKEVLREISQGATGGKRHRHR